MNVDSSHQPPQARVIAELRLLMIALISFGCFAFYLAMAGPADAAMPDAATCAEFLRSAATSCGG